MSSTEQRDLGRRTIGDIMKGPSSEEEQKQLDELSKIARQAFAKLPNFSTSDILKELKLKLPIVELKKIIPEIIISPEARRLSKELNFAGENLAKSIKAVNQFKLPVAENLLDAVRVADRLNRQIAAPILGALREHQEQLRNMGRLAVKTLQAYERFHIPFVEKHKSDGIAVPPFFYKYSLSDLARMFGEDRPAIEVYDDFFSDEDRVNELLCEWLNNDLYAERKEILQDALEAHVNGKHTLSVPVLLAQIEGILGQLFRTEVPGKIKSHIKALSNEAKRDDENSTFPGVGIVADTLHDQIYKAAYYEVEQPNPHRPRILHGHNIKYHRDRFASLRCILILDMLRMKEFDIHCLGYADQDE